MPIVKNLDSPFAGLGLFVWQSFWGGTDLTEADAAAYAKYNVQTVFLKCSDGLTGDPTYPADFQTAVAGGIKKVVPWAFLYGVSKPFFPLGQQVKVAIEAAGSLKAGDSIVFDIEESIDVPGIQAAMAQYAPGVSFAVCTWDNPSAHPGAPSIGELTDIGCAAFLPQSYYAIQGQTSGTSVATTVKNYTDLGLANPYVFVPVIDGPDILPAAQEAASQGCSGLAVWRHGANGITPAAFSGAPSFAPPPPTPAPAPGAEGTVSSAVPLGGLVAYVVDSVPAGGTVTLNGNAYVVVVGSAGSVVACFQFTDKISFVLTSGGQYVVVSTGALSVTVG